MADFLTGNISLNSMRGDKVTSLPQSSNTEWQPAGPAYTCSEVVVPGSDMGAASLTIRTTLIQPESLG